MSGSYYKLLLLRMATLKNAVEKFVVVGFVVVDDGVAVVAVVADAAAVVMVFVVGAVAVGLVVEYCC